MRDTTIARWHAVLSPRLIGLILLVAGLVAAGITFDRWWPALRDKIAPAAAEPHGDHEEDHSHSHGPDNSIEVSPQARKSIGLTIGKIALGDYERTITVPGIVVERPGRTSFHVTAPLTGIVTHLYATRGEAVSPGQKLFELRLTDEDVVASQAALLKTVEELDVIGREITRLEEVTRDGGLPRKELLERKYEQQKQQGVLRAQKQTLLLHGLSQAQVDNIVSTHMLLRAFTVFAPLAKEGDSAALVYQLQEMKVDAGQNINVGETLAVLVNSAELLVEGDAFERDMPHIAQVVERGWNVSIVGERGAPEDDALRGQKVLFVDGKVDPVSRTFHFYVALPNTIVRDRREENNTRYVQWKRQPGQRVQVLVPVESWREKIVLPSAAVAQDGAEYYVFQENGRKFDRRAVHVEHRDERSVVIANDGSLFVGDSIALSGAQQLLTALKNKAGGGVDPHAGHTH